MAASECRRKAPWGSET